MSFLPAFSVMEDYADASSFYDGSFSVESQEDIAADDGDTEATSVTLVSELQSTSDGLLSAMASEDEEDSSAIMIETLGSGSGLGSSFSHVDVSSEEEDESVESIGNDGFVTGIAPGTLVEILREATSSPRATATHENEEAASSTSSLGSPGMTILDSVPSEEVVSISESELLASAVQSAADFEVSSHPAIVLMPNETEQDQLSLSTTETGYVEEGSYRPQRQGRQLDDHSVDSASLLSLTPSMMNSSDYVSAASESSSILSEPQGRAGGTLHESAVYENVGSRLASASNGEGMTSGDWFTSLTEEDWDSVREEATEVMKALDPSAVGSVQEVDGSSLLLPPEPPVGWEDRMTTAENVVPADFVPAAFICPICSDVIVGATTLSCGCAKSTCCTSCWETHSVGVDFDRHHSELRGAEQRVVACPHCKSPVQHHVPCYAMDVATLQVVRGISSSTTEDCDGSRDVRAFQDAYFRRLVSWRNEILDRLKSSKEAEEQEKKDRLLALLMQQEEQLLWEKQLQKEKSKQQNGIGLLLGQIAVAVAVAALATAGIRAAVKR